MICYIVFRGQKETYQSLPLKIMFRSGSHLEIIGVFL